MNLARDIVIREWNLRRPVELDASGGWHVCNRDTCTIVHLAEYVCIEGRHLCDGACSHHPGGDVVYVSDVYACQSTGSMHICDQSTCTASAGQCVVSGRCCVAETRASVTLPVSNKRSRRRKVNCVHTNEQTACILVFDLLFSRRRISSEIQRATNGLELARRMAHRATKAAIRDGAPLHVQDLVDIYASSRQRMRDYSYMQLCADPDDQRLVCLYYARIVVSIWDLIMHSLPARSTFDSVAAAVLYSMRKGVACDGLYAIPRDRFMLVSLPDAHAIKDVGVARRALTQGRNALFRAINTYIASGHTTVEAFAEIFKSPPPAVIRTFLHVDN